MPSRTKAGTPRFAPVILAGGSGTRFWPRSRRARAKQVLALDGEQTMIQQTLTRLLPLAAPSDVWIVTNSLLDKTIAEQMPTVSPQHILSEPAARNTAPACALTAFLLMNSAPDTVLGVFPSDHVVQDIPRFAAVLKAGIEIAADGENIVVLGVPPTRPETGYGYIEQGDVVAEAEPASGGASIKIARVKRFPREAGSPYCRALSCGREFRMEWRNLSMERTHAGLRNPRALPGDGTNP